MTSTDLEAENTPYLILKQMLLNLILEQSLAQAQEHLIIVVGISASW
jgi:hypothetical protein